jgi:hypothetical protein
MNRQQVSQLRFIAELMPIEVAVNKYALALMPVDRAPSTAWPVDASRVSN